LSYPCEKHDVWWVVYKVNPHELLHTPTHVAYHIDDGYVGEVYQEQELAISFVIKPGVALDSLIRYDVDVIVLLKQK
jgi:hypothetical protein